MAVVIKNRVSYTYIEYETRLCKARLEVGCSGNEHKKSWLPRKEIPAFLTDTPLRMEYVNYGIYRSPKTLG
jgi:hypothetical protein